MKSGKNGGLRIQSNSLFIDNGAYLSSNSSDLGESENIDISTITLQISGKAPVISHDHFLESQLSFEQNLTELKKIAFSGIYSHKESQNYSDNPGGDIRIDGMNVYISDLR